MQLNATLFGQMITFAIFVWFTMRVVWPMLSTQLDTRRKQIADGLAAAEAGRKLLADAQHEAQQKVHETKLQCMKLLADADAEGVRIIEHAREQARVERDEIIAAGHVHITREVSKAKGELQQQVADIAVLGAEKILQRSVTRADHEKLLAELAQHLT